MGYFLNVNNCRSLAAVLPFALRSEFSYLLEVLLLFLWIGVIEAHDELAFERELVVLVEESRLSVADMQVSGHKGQKKWSLLKLLVAAANLMVVDSLLIFSRNFPKFPYRD